MTSRRLWTILLSFTFYTASFSWMSPAADWKPAKGPLFTRWAKDVSPDKVHPEYPRPQMVRKEWLNLNGLWDYAIRPRDEGKLEAWDGKILVPFAIESALSGVKKTVGEKNRLWYRRTFELPKSKGWAGKNVLLHFGAVDWECRVWINGEEVSPPYEGEAGGVRPHRGGYDPFSFDITKALKPSGPQEIIVSVWDPTDAGYQPRGKQVARPQGIWYTSVTGIWQTVWLEPVAKACIRSITLVPDSDTATARFRAECVGTNDRHKLNWFIHDYSRERGTNLAGKAIAQPGKEAVVKLNGRVQLWSPDDPFLYTLDVSLTEDIGGGEFELHDACQSYLAMRKIGVAKDSAGVNRLMLNNKPLFHFGPLDQGWWPDGLYTAPTDEALKYDIEMTKKLGFNMCRKHVKVEPDRWYYWCDQLGLMVWQDMPNGDGHIGGNDPDIKRSVESEANFRREWQAIIESRRNHPCIVAWVPFNEGWGQFKTNEILDWTKKLDPTRLVDGPSGWTDRGGGDMHDLHSYPGPGMPPLSQKRASVLGEFGGLGLPLEGHLWLKKGNWGYRTYKSREELGQAYRDLILRLQGLRAEGLAAAVYTQTTDVEIEVNGLMTYDRAVVKLPDNIAELHRPLYGPLPKVHTVVPTSEAKPKEWRFTTTKPAEGWQQPDFDAAAWKSGPGGFGTKGTPGAIVRTEWTTKDIWLRREFQLDRTDFANPYLRIHHDEDAEIYLNGKQAAAVKGYTVGYILVPLDKSAAAVLKKGKNTFAVHCRQTGGGQYIDVGIADMVPAKDAKR